MVTLVAIKTQYELAVAYQGYESIRLVAYEALGGKTSGKHSHNSSEAIQTMDDMVRRFQSFGGQVGG